MKYTLVQHSAAGYKGDPQFVQAVEERGLTPAEERKVSHLVGLVFNGYVEAHDRAYAENYPPGVRGIIPEARGTFAKLVIDGLKLYIPAREHANR